MSVNSEFGVNEALSLFFERSNALQTYWNFHLTVILGLLAFFGTTRITRKTKTAAALVSAAYMLLCRQS
jgi:hypothetical protein